MAENTTFALSADGTPIATMKVIDRETGTETPVNVATCTEAVICPEGKTAQEHLAALYAHANNDSTHLTPEQKASLETQQGAQQKADAAKTEAVTAASLLVESARVAAAEDATAKAAGARDAAYKYTDHIRNTVDAHISNTGNPHGVTAAQVGLGNVPNKATNDLTPTYTESDALVQLTSGERIAVAFGKIAKAISGFISHLANKSNPHGVTASQAGAVPKTGGTMTGNLTMDGGNIVLKEGINYGDELPEPGIPGRLFLKKVQNNG